MRETHGHAAKLKRSPEYWIWLAMKQRTPAIQVTKAGTIMEHGEFQPARHGTAFPDFMQIWVLGQRQITPWIELIMTAITSLPIAGGRQGTNRQITRELV